MSNSRGTPVWRNRLIAVAAAAVVIIAVVVAYREFAAPVANPYEPAQGEILARGRIEPLGRVLAISGPADGNLIRKLLVDEGSDVKAGQILAILDGFDVRSAEYELAQHNLELAELRRTQLDAGAKSSEVAAQRNVVAAKEAKLVDVQKEWERSNALYDSRVVTKRSMDSLKAELDGATADVAAAKNVLKSLTEVRGVDDQAADVQIAIAKSNVALAQAQMERLQIRAPTDGTVLSLQARAGEAISPEGILRMADLSHIIVVAEVDESEIGGVTVGQEARIKGDMLRQPVDASVSRILKEVYRQKRPSSDILVGRDARIVEVELTPKTALPAIMGGELIIHMMAAKGEAR